jgi:hypothetical protein
MGRRGAPKLKISALYSYSKSVILKCLFFICISYLRCVYLTLFAQYTYDSLNERAALLDPILVTVRRIKCNVYIYKSLPILSNCIATLFILSAVTISDSIICNLCLKAYFKMHLNYISPTHRSRIYSGLINNQRNGPSNP